MASEKAWYLVALGVLALGVSHSFLNSHADWTRCLADRSDALVDEVSGQALRYVAVGDLILGRGETGLARTQTVMTRVQTRVAAAETRAARQQAQMVCLRSQRVRLLVNQRMQRAVVACPRQKVIVNLPQPPAVTSAEPTDDKI
jgi:hypothetical protein